LKSFPPLPEKDLAHIRDHTAELWEEARGKNFFITGGTGFFGIWLLESFIFINDALGLGATATVLSRDPARFARKAPHLAARKDLLFHQGDIRNFEPPQGSYDYLIHAATEASAQLNREQPGEMLDSIVSGMRHILRFAETKQVSKFLFTSSGAVYGKQPSGLSLISEEFTGAPDCLGLASAYGEGKRVAELMGLIQAENSDCAFKVARCFAFVGPHLPLDAHFAIGNFIGDAVLGRPIRIEGDGTTLRSYLYAGDLTVWLWVILFKGPSGRAYNVGSEQSEDLATIADSVSRAVKGGSNVEIEGEPSQSQAISCYVPSTQRAALELGLQTCIDLDEAIARTVTWYLTNNLSEHDE
jgi:dTDP-glucose 4,6-dehydratase